MIISIEGNIGSGKSTFIKHMKESYPNFVYIQEPVDVWNTITDNDNNTILSLFYNDQEKYAFSFQMMTYITRLSAIRKAIKDNPDKIIIMERSLNTDKNVFAKMLYDNGKISDIDFEIYNRWFDEFSIPVTKYIYLYTSPDISQQRINKRNRTGEELISLDYLKVCHQSHERWLNNMESNMLKLNVSSNNDTDILNTWLQTTFDFIIG